MPHHTPKDTNVNKTMPSTEVRPHVVMLLRRMSMAELSRRSGVHKTTISDLGTGRQQRLRISTAQALLAIEEPTQLVPRINEVDSLPTQRRLQALGAIGYSIKELSHLIPAHRAHLGRVANHGGFISVNLATKVEALYPALLDRPRPTGWLAARTVRRAADQGWAPPSAWVGRDMADPQASPDETDWLGYIELLQQTEPR